MKTTFNMKTRIKIIEKDGETRYVAQRKGFSLRYESYYWSWNSFGFWLFMSMISFGVIPFVFFSRFIYEIFSFTAVSDNEGWFDLVDAKDDIDKLNRIIKYKHVKKPKPVIKVTYIDYP